MFYTRAELTVHIEALAAARAMNNEHAGTDVYDDYKTSQADGGALPVKEDTPHVDTLQGKVAKDTADARSSLEGVRRWASAPPDRERQLIRRIKDNLQTLSFIEKRSLHSYEQINGLYKAAYATYNKVAGEISCLEKEVGRLEKVRPIAEKIDSVAGAGKIQHDIALSLKRLQSLKPQIDKGREEISRYEQCVRTLDRIDRKNGTRDEQAMKEHYRIRAKVRSMEESRDRGVKSRGYER